MFTPIGLLGPYNATSVNPATIVGSARGRSIAASMRARPGKRSRTRTQAVAVPTTTLTSATTRLKPTVSSRAASVCGLQRRPRALLPGAGGLADERGDRNQHDQA